MGSVPRSGHEIRGAFLSFFQQKQHLIVPSASLVPQGDPTLLLTSAGMVPMKPFFMGEAIPPSPRMASAQKCFRSTDIEKVGDEQTLTFFEMLGNFSIGDYFKRGAVEFAWEFVTGWLGMPPDRIWVTVYPDDREAVDIWREVAGLPEGRIVPQQDNWWGPAGETGPTGPDSELYYDRGETRGCGREGCGPGCECGRYLEFWNLVFTQYHKDETGAFVPLPQKHVDTGLGLERVAMLMQGGSSVYDTDLLRPVVRRAEELARAKHGRSPRTDRSLRILADHSRAVTFLLADGVSPSNAGRGYVLRRVLRRAIRHGRLLGVERPFMGELSRVVVDIMTAAYPELRSREDAVRKVIEVEEERFARTLAAGLAALDRLIDEVRARGEGVIPGEAVFRLYDTYGFPEELTAEVAREAGLAVDESGFGRAMAEQRARARAAHRFGAPAKPNVEAYRELALEVGFLGYERLEATTQIVALIADGELLGRADAGEELEIVLRETPFYPESGGQVGDTGTIVGPAGRAEVVDTRRPTPDLIVHDARVADGYLLSGDVVLAAVDAERRDEIRRHHTATHLVHKALQHVLGPHAQQAGSLVASDRLRFDFTHPETPTPDQLARVEAEVNERIRADLQAVTRVVSREEAMAAGATALFAETYGEHVRLLCIGDYSCELCGGTHVRRTGEIGQFVIVREEGVAAGVRRIEALAGRAAEEYVRRQLGLVRRLTRALRGDPEQALAAIQAELAQARSEAARLRSQLLDRQAKTLSEHAEDVDGLRVAAAVVSAPDVETLRALGEALLRHLGRGVGVVGSVVDGVPRMVAVAAPGLGVGADDVARELARAVGGRGGGRPGLAQAGGGDPSRLAPALRQVPSLVRQMRRPVRQGRSQAAG